ncbi:peptide/nickel transport system permease protein [Rhizobium sp. BIGb0125]|uniref:ABC transporter permease n=1 Tax=Rhizobium sp. BIGb0125 TaxID=2940618 RepID=UPI00386B8D5D|nr:peptide/nickel transport system permease protein [Rhizobium sp. BIGb0125]
MLRAARNRPAKNTDPTRKLPARKRIDAFGAVGLFGLLLVTVVALLPDLFTPFDPQLRVAQALLPPSTVHLFGTDEIGRDLFSRVVLGVRYTWIPSLIIVAVSFVLGSTIGLVSGFFGGWIDIILQRVTDIFFIVPSMLFAIAFAAVLGPGIEHTVLAIMMCWWPWYTWIARDELRRIHASPHYAGARVAGATKARLLFRYSVPGVIPSLIVAAGVDVSNVVMTLSLMSFLGLGEPNPAPELGALVSRSLDSLATFWWLPILPAVAIFFICLSANLLGDGIRHMLKGR